MLLDLTYYFDHSVVLGVQIMEVMEGKKYSLLLSLCIVLKSHFHELVQYSEGWLPSFLMPELL
jgi:hypothetical protein